MHTRRAIILLGATALVGAAWGVATLTAGASAPVTGQESFYLAFLKVGSSSGQIVTTGVFTDAGTDKSINATLDKEVFKKGSFEIDHHLLSISPTVNTTTCALIDHANGPVTLEKGTGIYKNLKGTMEATINVYYVTKRTTTGCDDASTPLGGFTEITASGPITD